MKRETNRWIQKAEEDFQGAKSLAKDRPPPRDLVCFHCQQSAEKYLKALLQESGLQVPRTHNLDDLLTLLLPHDSSLKKLARGLVSLSRFAVDFRYPGKRATKREMQSTLRWAERVRRELRVRLGLPP
jgi:HEPN domain-containing protein